MSTTIATGLWQDRSQNAVLGAILTLPMQQANLLLTALAVLVTLTAASFWNLTALLLHSLHARGPESDPLGLQLQVVLRNSSTSVAAALQALKIQASWRGKGLPRSWVRSCSVVMPALVIWAVFTIASILTSRVALTDQSGSVIARLQPGNCGFFTINTSTTAGFLAYQNKILNDTVQARNYVSSFYNSATASFSVRSNYKSLVFPHELNTTAACPFSSPDRCKMGKNGAFNMKTAFLDSHSDLGINANPSDRVTFQYSLTCSPIFLHENEGKEVVNGDETDVEVDIGPLIGVDVPYTFLYNKQTVNTTAGYDLEPYVAYFGDSADGINGSTWNPIPDFNLTDADVTVLFLTQNDVIYLEPTLDPWFYANGSIPTRFLIDNQPGYHHNILVNTMMCTEQYVICNPATNNCSSPQGLVQLGAAVRQNDLGLNPSQRMTAYRISHAMIDSNTYMSVAGPRGTALWAQSMAFGLLSPGLPDDQWRLETLGWFHVSLVKLQEYLVEYASQSGNLGSHGNVTQPSEFGSGDGYKALVDQCSNQLVRTAGEVQNFSFLGVMIIACFSAVVIILDILIEPVLTFYYNRQKSGEPPLVVAARQADSMLHLLRFALQNLGSGTDKTWREGSWGVPI